MNKDEWDDSPRDSYWDKLDEQIIKSARDDWGKSDEHPIQSGGSAFPFGKTKGDGLADFQRWVDGIKRDLNSDSNKERVKITLNEDDDCICEACVEFTAWDDLYPDDFELDASEVYDELFDILVKKQADYGPNNIQNAPGGPLNGLQVRLYDKMSRLVNLIQSGVDPKNESLRDTFVDIANYGAIGVMILDGTFPKAKD